MIVHHQFCILLLVTFIDLQLISCKKGKTIDYSSEIDDDTFPLPYNRHKPWLVSFPKNDRHNKQHDTNYDDNSNEKGYNDEEEDDEFYKKPNEDFKKPYYNSKPYKNDYYLKLNKKPYEDDYDTHYDHHDYDNFDLTNKRPAQDNYVNHNKKPTKLQYETNFNNQKPSSYYNNKYVHKGNKYDKKPLNNKPYDNRPHENEDDDEKPYNNYNQQYSKPNHLTCHDKEETCSPLHKCPINIRFDDYDAVQKCTLKDGSDGVCCPPAESPSPRDETVDLPISKKATKVIYPKHLRYFPNVNKNQFRSVGDDYDERAKYIKKIERILINRRLTPAKNSPEMAHHNFFGLPNSVESREANRLSRKGENSLQRAIEIAKNYLKKLTPSTTLTDLMASYTANIEKNATECPVNPACTINRYRSPDGTCNNKLFPLWGKALSPYNRVLNPNYGDGINSPKLSKAKEELPNVRDLSVELTRHKHPSSSRLSLVTMQFGQLIDHDIASAAPTRTEKGTPISCCRPEIQADPQNLRHPACYEIKISKNDPFYREFNVTCMNFVRSAPTTRADCRLAPREQLNQPTSFIDASQIYGSSLETQLSLRELSGGRLISSLINKFHFLPSQTNGTCNVPGNDVRKCFRAGDPRVNENIDLTVMQTIFLREHNRIANQLEQLNPNWSDEYIYQETKAIISAILQHITYSEFLPAVLNRRTMRQFDLYPNENGYSNKYDSTINPTLFNSFATAAYRWHSTIQGALQLRNSKEEIIGEIPLSNTFNNPTFLIKKNMLDNLIRGMTSQSMQELDQYFTGEITNKLFRPFNSTFGLDIFSLNVQRGRDHGLKGYPAWRKQCGLEDVRKFGDLNLSMSKNLVNTMKRFYSTVYDIDLYVAGILENHLPNSELGPTFSCIVAEQFRRLKLGDRFWYENSGQIHSFTAEQLAEIKKVTIARLFCDNGDHIKQMQPHAFILPKYFWNKKVSCQNLELIPRINLEPWF